MPPYLQWHSMHCYLMIIPFSIENASVGRPAMFHDRILTGSPRVLLREKSALHGIPFSWHSVLHSLICSWRKAEVNAPRYATTPADISTSPVKLFNCSSRSSAALPQRVFSPPRPPISFSALLSFLEQISTWSASSAFRRVFSSNCR